MEAYREDMYIIEGIDHLINAYIFVLIEGESLVVGLVHFNGFSQHLYVYIRCPYDATILIQKRV